MNRAIRPRATCFVLLFGLFASTAGLPAADLSVNSLQLYTRGYLQNGTFLLDSRSKFDLSIGGGYKFGAKLSFGFDTTNADFSAVPSTSSATTMLQRVLLFNGAQISAKHVLGSNVDLAYFIGLNDVLASGSVFPDRYGTSSVGSSFGGYLSYPTPPTIEYDGIYRISGTGIRVSLPSEPTTFLVDAYLHTDAYLGTGVYAADVRAAINSEQFKVETFAGASFPHSPYGLYRAGLFFYYSPSDTGQFLTGIGLPYWSPDVAFSASQLYLLLEPRVRVNPVSVILTLFWHPAYYLEAPTNEGGAFDLNVRLQLGNEQTDRIAAGFDNLISLYSAGTNDFAYTVSPFLRMNTTGVIWDFKISALLLPFDPGSLFEAYIGIRTEF
ncbi:MAG TPA: hypothetical protein VMW87_11910 [Spirochaetia bacterium]|nr:hypothetical protein [Spirochaetia bacterium]